MNHDTSEVYNYYYSAIAPMHTTVYMHMHARMKTNFYTTEHMDLKFSLVKISHSTVLYTAQQDDSTCTYIFHTG